MDRTTPVAVGIDPGGRYVGIVARTRDDVLSARVLDRRRVTVDDDLTTWVRSVAVVVDDTVQGLARTRPPIIAAEGVRPPNPHVRRRDGNSLTNPAGIIDTAAVLGGLILAFVDLVVVEPRGNGGRVAAAYPEPIAKGARLGGPSDHARSAYDVAGAALWLDRTGLRAV